MVDDSAQLYTIEGVAAGVIMLFTAFLVLSTTTVYAPGDTHISEMQLEQMASDALAMMDTPDRNGEMSDLENYVRTDNTTDFNDEFLMLIGNSAYALEPNAEMFSDEIQYQATVYYHLTGTSTVGSYILTSSSDLAAHEPAVTATRLVYTDWKSGIGVPDTVKDRASDPLNPPEGRDQIVLLEVLVWRG